jgi:hypothetical protein
VPAWFIIDLIGEQFLSFDGSVYFGGIGNIIWKSRRAGFWSNDVRT